MTKQEAALAMQKRLMDAAEEYVVTCTAQPLSPRERVLLMAVTTQMSTLVVELSK